MENTVCTRGHNPKPQHDPDTGVLSHYVCKDCLERCSEDGGPPPDKTPLETRQETLDKLDSAYRIDG